MRPDDRRALAAAALEPVRGHCSEGYERALSEVEDAIDLAQQEGIRAASDADIAREFWRRFRPIQVHLGEWRGRAAVAELEDDGSWISEALPDGSGREEHAAGDAGFAAALERARELVK